jgi:hypothetical protein
MVDFLFEAHRFFPSRFPSAHDALCEEWRNIRKCKHMQANVFKIVHSVMHDTDFAGHLSRRLCLWFPDMIHDKAALHAHMSSMLEAIVKTRPQVRVCMLTVLNAWTTSGRAHESKRLSCLFGCDSAQDELKHYIQCPKLWSSMYSHPPDTATSKAKSR